MGSVKVDMPPPGPSRLSSTENAEKLHLGVSQCLSSRKSALHRVHG